MPLITFQSFILQAVIISTPASAASGILEITGARKNIAARRTIEWQTLVSLVFPPDLIATAVLAIAAVAGTPPKNGMTILPMPCAISS